MFEQKNNTGGGDGGGGGVFERNWQKLSHLPGSTSARCGVGLDSRRRRRRENFEVLKGCIGHFPSQNPSRMAIFDAIFTQKNHELCVCNQKKTACDGLPSYNPFQSY